MKFIIEHLDRHASAQPDRLLFAFLDLDGRETSRYTYATFAQRTRDVAEHLVSRYELASGDRVLLAYPPGLDVIVAFFACARIGVIPVPVYPPSPTGSAATLTHLNDIATDCGASAILSMSGREASRIADGLAWIATDLIAERASVGFRDSPGEVLFLQYTSGSTAAPRGVIVSHANVIHNALATVDHIAIGVSWLPQYHDMGLIGYYLFPVITGATTYGLSPTDFLKRPAVWLQTISRVRATYSSSPNFGFDYCLRPRKIEPDDLDDVDLSCVRVLMNAAEPVRTDSHLRFQSRFAAYGLDPQAHMVAYGLAENTLAATHYGRSIVAVDKSRLRKHEALIVDSNDGDSCLHLASCGRPLDEISVRIVDPKSHTVLPDRAIGEIWLSGKSVCRGYWGRPELTREVFENALPGDEAHYLRTGDLAFLHDGELFVSGRMKDLIILRGTNVYPQDIETAVQSISPKICGVAAFAGNGTDDTLTVVVEVKGSSDLPNPHEIARVIRVSCHIEPRFVVLARPHTIVKTTSGKIARMRTREKFLNGTLPSILIHDTSADLDAEYGAGLKSRFRSVFALCRATQDQSLTFAEMGVDSLTLADFVLELETVLTEQGAHTLIGEIDVELLQRLTVADLAQLLDRLEQPTPEAIAACHSELRRIRTITDSSIQSRMRSDATLRPDDLGTIEIHNDEPARNVLVTGVTGFFGPFLLEALLRQTPYKYYVLTRAKSQGEAMDRLRTALCRSMLWNPEIGAEVERRVHVVCGDLSRENLGLTTEEWASLARDVHMVLHNAAFVNYVLNYHMLKPDNVDGTRTLLRLAHSTRRKEFHFISSTFIFGWTAKGLLIESDNNDEMSSLDFGYSQTKWVAEQLVRTAGERGLDIYVYRPSLLSASAHGIGDRNDVAIRMLSFMIKYGIAVDTKNQLSILPVDSAAANIAAIFSAPRRDARSFHITADSYYNMKDVTEVMTSDYGYLFTYYDIPAFIEQMNRLCTKSDPLYPLLDFFNRSATKIAAMQLKRYHNGNYVAARAHGYGNASEPALRDTVSYMMSYMLREKLIPPISTVLSN
jgi:thioester reductase-like protein